MHSLYWGEGGHTRLFGDPEFSEEIQDKVNSKLIVGSQSGLTKLTETFWMKLCSRINWHDLENSVIFKTKLFPPQSAHRCSYAMSSTANLIGQHARSARMDRLRACASRQPDQSDQIVVCSRHWPEIDNCTGLFCRLTDAAPKRRRPTRILYS